jgi:hypothetical protein
VKSGRSENDASPSLSKGHEAWNLPLTTKHGTFQKQPSMEPFIGHQVRHLSLPPSFLFSLKTQIWVIWLFLYGPNFQFESLKTYSYNFPWEDKND